jgi:hypothetical protein
VIIFTSPAVRPQSGGATREYQVKALFLLNLAKFVDWPASSFPVPQASFVICVVGQDPFGASLDDATTGHMIGDRGIEVDRYPSTRNLSEAQFCQIVFVSSSEKQRLRKIITFYQNKNALLVGDTQGFASTGGAIEFQMDGDQVRFTINPDAAEHAGLKLSSKLLSLATIVHGDSTQGNN